MRELLAQNPDKEYDLICSDIENFKLINDVFGMPAGDRLLCGIAALYTEMVGTGAFAATSEPTVSPA